MKPRGLYVYCFAIGWWLRGFLPSRGTVEMDQGILVGTMWVMAAVAGAWVMSYSAWGLYKGWFR